jgi:hypothetical protein
MAWMPSTPSTSFDFSAAKDVDGVEGIHAIVGQLDLAVPGVRHASVLEDVLHQTLGMVSIEPLAS